MSSSSYFTPLLFLLHQHFLSMYYNSEIFLSICVYPNSFCDFMTSFFDFQRAGSGRLSNLTTKRNQLT